MEICSKYIIVISKVTYKVTYRVIIELL